MAASSPAGPQPPELSVIVPCWNAADSIERALQSVLADPAAPVECVVVDDGSTDATVAIVEAMAVADPRVVLIRSPQNAGASAARNIALERFRGTWVTFLDADDILTDGGVEALLRPSRSSDALAVIGQRTWSDGTRSWVTALYDIPDIREPGRKSLASAPGLVYYASATGKAFHRSLVGDLRFEGRVLGDQPWALRALLRAGDRIEVVAEDVYVWLRAPTEMTHPRSITATTRSTAGGSAEAVRVAIVAHAQVTEEARRAIDDPATQRRIARVYLERLLRSDLGVYLKRALDRRDPALAELLVAFGEFLESVPRDLLAEEGPLVTRTLLKPLLDAWPWLPPESRNAFWDVVRPAVAADPAVYRQMGGGRMGRAAVRLVGSVDSGPTRALATAATGRAVAARTRSAAKAPPA